MPKNSPNHQAKNQEFELEKYKSILQQIHTLNENFYKYLTLFQTLTTAIVGGGVGVLIGWQNLQIKPDIAVVGMRSLEGLLVLITIFFVMLLIAGMASWFDYRKEEFELLNRLVEENPVKLPSLKNFWRWHETYLIFFIIGFTVIVSIFTESQIIPLIK